MPIHNQIRLVPLDEIFVDRDSRQRTKLDPEKVIDLALRISSSHWISPILLQTRVDEPHKLMAGETRFTAVSWLRLARGSEANLEALGLSAEQRAQLIEASIHCPEPLEVWSKIPAQLGTNITEDDLDIFEFIENNTRTDLSWQDKARAAFKIHTKRLAALGKREWTVKHTASLLGLSQSYVARMLEVIRSVQDEEPRKLTIFNESGSLQAAYDALQRFNLRRDEPLTLTGFSTNNGAVVMAAPKAAPKPAPEANFSLGTNTAEADPDKPLPHEIIAPIQFFNESFHDFAAAYDGPLFSFIHCDFPYGIEFNQGAGMGTAVDTKLQGDYDDSQTVYFDLIHTLAKYKRRLISPSAHLMFWYSQSLEDETKARFASLFPDATVQTFKLIWHKSDNAGVVPDPQRYGRRTYETAMLLTFGDRFIVTPKALSLSHPTENNLHRSQKPRGMLKHFFEMFVDDASSVLDPTAGSATSLLAAHDCGASRIVGLEMNTEAYDRALAHLVTVRSKK